MVSWLEACGDWAEPGGRAMGAINGAAARLLAWANDDDEPLLMRLPPETRARVLMALLGLVIVGLALVGLAIWGRRYVLRRTRQAHGPTPRLEDAWYRKPLAERDASRDASEPE